MTTKKKEPKAAAVPGAPHGRKAGPAGALCSHCRWIDSSNEKIGNPPGLGCRIVRAVRYDTPACFQFAPKGAKEVPHNSKALLKARKDYDVVRSEMFQKQVGDCLTTGSYFIDLVTGGGIPGGKLVVYYGPEHCLAADTFVHYNVRNPDGSRANHKGGTIENLYHRFHNLPKRCGVGSHNDTTIRDAVYTAPSINEEGRIFHNRIVDVVLAGKRECFELTTTAGETIVATADHRFFNGTKYVKLKTLMAGATVYVHDQTRYTAEVPANTALRQYVHVKHHGVAGTHNVKVGNVTYVYKRLAVARAMMEAEANGLTYDDYISRLNDGDIAGFKFLPSEVLVHHVDEDYTNDTLGNLMLTDLSSHSREHAFKNHNNLRYMAMPREVSSIKSVGIRTTYDIEMEAPFNNFVANDFVVHNSGKSTMCFKSMAAALRVRIPTYPWDAEESWDSNYIRSNGVDFNDPLFYPDRHRSGDHYYNYMVHLMRELPDRKDGPPQLLAVADSAAAFLSAMTSKDPGKSGMVMGPSAVHSAGLPKIKGLMGEKKVSFIATNHVGQKPASGRGNPEYEKGGDALKFYSDIRLRIAKRVSNGNGATRLLPPYFRTDDKVYVTEKSHIKGGTDRFGYAQVTVRKNKGFSGGQMGLIRILTSGAGEPGLDLSYDLFQCLVATGQAEWLGKNRVRIALSRPVYGADGLEHKRVKPKDMTWTDFKILVFGRGEGSVRGPDIEEIWQTQMACGWAIKQYLDIQSFGFDGLGDDDEEGEENDEGDDSEYGEDE